MRLRRELFAQRTYYRNQMQNIRRQMAEIWLEPLESGRTARYWTKLMIRMKAKLGMTVETAAKLMVEGTNMGMVQLRQLLNHNPNIPTDLKTQGEKILSHEQEYLARITPYL